MPRNKEVVKPGIAGSVMNRQSARLLFLVGAMLALLALLASLQYRWLGQVSQAEGERMRASLSAGVERFRQDFDREITGVFVTFSGITHVSDEISENRPSREMKRADSARRYAQWLATAPHPKLVRSVFHLEREGKNSFRLFWLNPATHEFQPVAWPAEFWNLKKQLEDPPESRLTAPPGPVVWKHLDPIEEDIPALVMPLLVPVPVPPRVDSWEYQSEYRVVALDKDYLVGELIPNLVKRYFSGEQGLDYRVTISSDKRPGEFIYESSPDLSHGEDRSSDLAVSLFNLHPEEIGASIGPFPPPSLRRVSRGSIRQDKIFTVRILDKQVKAFHSGFAMKLGEGGYWRLKVKHRAGSLEDVVASLRRRNLFLSSGILLLLAGSITILIFSTQRSQRLARQQMEFVAGVSHELRTPLAVICAAGENLADGVISEPEQVRRYGTLIEGEGRRLNEMVGQVLEFSGMQSGRRMQEVRPLDISQVVDGALETLQAAIVAGGFEVERQVQEDLPAAMADAGSLRNALQNLLNNAMKYSGNCRWIGVRAHTAAVGDKATELQVNVEDRGLGIDKTDLPHIFEPFYRGKEVVAAQIHGNGLGLSLVKQAMEAIGGRVSVVSELGRGSRFTLHLPLHNLVEVERKTVAVGPEQVAT